MAGKPGGEGGLIVFAEMPLHGAHGDAAELCDGLRFVTGALGNVTPGQLRSRSVGAGEERGDGSLKAGRFHCCDGDLATRAGEGVLGNPTKVLRKKQRSLFGEAAIYRRDCILRLSARN